MKLSVCTRTYNEEHRVEKFCASAAEYADKILIADGGSTDRTVELASAMPKVEVRPFHKQVECANGIMRNPDGEHIQFLIDWAEQEGDWLMVMDCDHRLNRNFKDVIRERLETSTKDFIMGLQIFMWGHNQYFPRMSAPDGSYVYGQMGWRTSVKVKMVCKMPHFEFSMDGKKPFYVDRDFPNRREIFAPPCGFLHFGWETEEMVQNHIKYYRNSGLIEEMKHPRDFGGALSSIQDWMVE